MERSLKVGLKKTKSMDMENFIILMDSLKKEFSQSKNIKIDYFFHL